MAKISVLIPCYNEEKYIHDAVASVVDQTEDDWELVIVDDGSTDMTSTMLDACLVEFSDRLISVVHTMHKGCANATKTAIDNSSAPICTILDGDDFLESRSLETILNEFNSDPELGYAWCRYKARSEHEGHVGNWKEGRSRALPEGQTLFEALKSGWWGALAQRCFRRRAYDLTNGLNPEIPYVVDQQLGALFALSGCKARHLPKVTYFHRQWNRQMSATHYREQQVCREKVMDMLGVSYIRER